MRRLIPSIKKPGPTFGGVPIQMRLPAGLLENEQLTFATSATYIASLMPKALRVPCFRDSNPSLSVESYANVITLNTEFKGVDAHGYKIVCSHEMNDPLSKKIAVNKSQESKRSSQRKSNQVTKRGSSQSTSSIPISERY